MNQPPTGWLAGWAPLLAGPRCRLRGFGAPHAARAAGAFACPAHPTLRHPPMQRLSFTMESITELLESLQQHFGGVAPNGAAATDAERMVVCLGEVAQGDCAGLSSAHAGLDR